MTKRIVVVGGGYGGVALVRGLAARGLDASVTLIDRNPYHTILTEVHTVAAGNRTPQSVLVPFHEMKGTRFLLAEVTGFDTDRRRVETTAGPLDYDLLVLALGGVDTDFGVPGVKEHALMLHSLKDALTLQERLDALPPDAPVLIAGGGLTGVELAAELGLRRTAGGNLTLIEAAPAILPGQGRLVQRGARRRLGALGVNVLTGTRIARVEEGMVHFTDGSALPYALLVWACGVRANPLVARLGLAVDKAGRLPVDECQMTALPGVYAIGDCAAGYAPTAQAASQVGAALAEHIATLLETGKRRPVRRPVDKGTLVALGHGYAVGRVGPLQLTGLLPAILKRATVALWVRTADSLCAAARYFLGLGARPEQLPGGPAGMAHHE